MKIRKILSITILMLLLTVGIGWSVGELRPMSKAGNTIEKCISYYGGEPLCIDMDIAIAEYMIRYPVQFKKVMERLGIWDAS